MKFGRNWIQRSHKVTTQYVLMVWLIAARCSLLSRLDLMAWVFSLIMVSLCYPYFVVFRFMISLLSVPRPCSNFKQNQFSYPFSATITACRFSLVFLLFLPRCGMQCIFNVCYFISENSLGYYPKPVTKSYSTPTPEQFAFSFKIRKIVWIQITKCKFNPSPIGQKHRIFS